MAFLDHPAVKSIAKYGTATAVAIAVPFIASVEDIRTRAYRDPVGYWTVCYGETKDVTSSTSHTVSECRRMLEERTWEFAAAVDVLVIPPLSDRQLAAFTSFTYNVGVNNFTKSTMLKKLNAGDIRGACNELPKWVYAKGKKLRGLVNRREKERKLCLS